MNQSRLNWCMILHIHCEETDKLDLAAIANEFVGKTVVDRIFFENLCNGLMQCAFKIPSQQCSHAHVFIVLYLQHAPCAVAIILLPSAVNKPETSQVNA